MGAAISDLLVHLREAYRNRESSGSLDRLLSEYTKSYLATYQETSGKDRYTLKQEKENLVDKMVIWKGPFKTTLEYLWEKDTNGDGSLKVLSIVIIRIRSSRLMTSKSAWGFFASVWGGKLVTTYQNLQGRDLYVDAGRIAQVVKTLTKIVKEGAWYDEEDDVFVLPSHRVRFGITN